MRGTTMSSRGKHVSAWAVALGGDEGLFLYVSYLSTMLHFEAKSIDKQKQMCKPESVLHGGKRAKEACVPSYVSISEDGPSF